MLQAALAACAVAASAPMTRVAGLVLKLPPVWAAPVGQDPNAKAGRFGFAVDNTIGATPQPNDWMDDWVEFYRERRLRHQLSLLGDARLTALAKPVLENLEWWFTDIRGDIKPAILHGDL